MKNRPLAFICFLITVFVLGLSSFSYAGDAKHTLKSYLDYRGERNFKKCCEFYTEKFITKFAHAFGDTCTNWFIESEMHFTSSEIVQAADGGLRKFRVETTIEDPTSHPITVKATEYFNLIFEKDVWRIDGWSIEYE